MLTGCPFLRPTRSALRFSVRGTIVAVLLVGVWLGWIVRSARVQREAVAAILEAGGAAAYGWGAEEFSYPVDGPVAALEWFVGLVGADFFGRVIAVSLKSFSSESESAFANIRRLSHLEELDFSKSSFGDAELLHI